MAEKGGWGFGPFRLEPGAVRLWRGTEAVALPPKLLVVLNYLVEHHGQLVGKDQLLDGVWGHRHVSEGILKGCITTLRKALGDDPQTPRYIETVARRGYRFMAEVRVLDGFPARGSQESPGADGGTRHWVGREAVLERLQELWQVARSGDRQLVFVSGEAGIGKSTLIEMFVQRLSESAPGVLWGQCIEQYGAGEAFLPLLEALSRIGDSERVKTTLHACAPTWLSQLPRLLTAEERAGLQREVLGATRERMLREGCELLEALSAEAPLMVVLEDLHWSDYATLDLLAALGRRREAAALLVLGSLRPSDVVLGNHPLLRIKQELRAHRLCSTLPLEPFSPAEMSAYLDRRFPEGRFPEAIARIIHCRTGGHPLFVVNLIDYLLAEGKLRQTDGWWSIAGGADDLECGVPDDIRRMIDHQIARLSPDDQQLLGVASASRMESSAALLAAALGKDVIAVEASCEALARQGPMLVAAGVAEWPDGTVAGNYAFRHALYSEILYQRLPPAYRADLHQRLGERLERAYGERSGEIAAELARHFEEGRDFAKTVRYLRLAADQAGLRFANHEALDYLGRALALVERLPSATRIEARLALLEQRASVHRTLNDWPGVVADVEALVNLARAEGYREREVGGLMSLGFALLLYDPSRCLAVMDEAVERSRDLSDEGLKSYAEALHVYFHLDMGNWPGSREQEAIVCAVDIARQSRSRSTLPFHLMLYSSLQSYRSDYRAALAAAQEVSQLGQEAGDGFHCVAGHFFTTWALLHLGEWGELRKVLSEGLRVAEQNASPFVWTLFQLMAAWLHIEALDFRGGWELCERTQPRAGDPHALCFRPVLLGRAHLGLGKHAEAARCFGETGAALEGDALIERRFRLMFRLGVGDYWLAQGEQGRARTEAEKLLELAGPPGERTYLTFGHRLLAEIAMDEESWDEADAHLSKALALLDGADVPLAAWRVHVTAGELHRRQGRWDEAEGSCAKAAAGLIRLAESLDESDPLRQSLFAHPLLQFRASLPAASETFLKGSVSGTV